MIRGSSFAISVLMGIVTALAGARATAQTCQCDLGPIGRVVWPPDGATDVPRDTPIVVQRHYPDGDLDAITFALEDQDGVEVALEELRRMNPAWTGCGEGQFLFLRPTDPLTPGETYTLSIGGDPAPADRRGATFAVVAETFEPADSLTVDPIYLSVRPEIACDEPRCRLGEIYIDLGAPPARPLWFVGRSASDPTMVNHWEFRAGYQFGDGPLPEWAGTGTVSLALPPEDPCIDIEVFGVDGKTLLEDTLCEPERCAVYALVDDGFCGSPPRSGVDAAKIPADSCDDPPVLQIEPGVGIEYPDAGPMPEGAGSGGAGDGGGGRPSVDAGVAGAGSDAGMPPVFVIADGGADDAGATAAPDGSPDERNTRPKDSGCRVGSPGVATAAPPWWAVLGLALALGVVRQVRRRRA